MEINVILFVIVALAMFAALAVKLYLGRDDSDESDVEVEETTWTVRKTPDLRQYTITFPDGRSEELVAINHNVNSDGIIEFSKLNTYTYSVPTSNRYGIYGDSSKDRTVIAEAKEHTKQYVSTNVESIEWEDYPALEREITVRGKKRTKDDKTRWEAIRVEEVLVG